MRISDWSSDVCSSDLELRRADGTAVWCRLQSSVLCDDDGEPVAIVAHVQDIEAERAAAEALRSKTRWFSAIVERSHDMIVLNDAGGRISWVRPAAGQLLGSEPSELTGTDALSLVHEAHQAAGIAGLEGVRRGESVRVKYRV